MREPRRDPSFTRILRLVWGPVLIVCILSLPGAALALQAPPPPNTPTYTVVPPTNTPVPPTNTPVPPTNTPVPPTSTSRPESPTATAVPPTETRPPSEPTGMPVPGNTPAAGESGQPEVNLLCQSMVEGYVLGTSGQKVTGATVTIEGDGWSSGIMTDDKGRYGFAGLCPGTATLRAVLASGQSGPQAAVSLTGQNSLRQDLSFASSMNPAPAAQATTLPVATAAAEAGMPITGYTGVLLVGGAALGALLLVSAGGRRALQAFERARSRK